MKGTLAWLLYGYSVHSDIKPRSDRPRRETRMKVLMSAFADDAQR